MERKVLLGLWEAGTGGRYDVVVVVCHRSASCRCRILTRSSTSLRALSEETSSCIKSCRSRTRNPTTSSLCLCWEGAEGFCSSKVLAARSFPRKHTATLNAAHSACDPLPLHKSRKRLLVLESRVRLTGSRKCRTRRRRSEEHTSELQSHA